MKLSIKTTILQKDQSGDLTELAKKNSRFQEDDFEMFQSMSNFFRLINT